MVAPVVVVLLASLTLFGGTGAAEATPLPDLGMAPIRDVRIETLADGHKVLRFTSEVVNVGSAPFEVRGSRPNAATTTNMTGQQYLNGAPVGQPVEFVFAGDNHNHWHVKNLARYTLRSLDTTKTNRLGAKVGFCFADSAAYRPDAGPATYPLTACGTDQSLSVTMGLTAGWGDVYPSYLMYQWVDVTGLKRGNYRLEALADAGHLFVESSTANNSTWINVKIGRGTKVTVTATGPGA
ncbi:MAG: hypothetical protein QOE35_1190 [Actinomycetota bacterium]